MIRIKVDGGTVTDGHKCLTCIHGITTETSTGQQSTYCSNIKRSSRNTIVKCDAWAEKPEPAPLWMLDVAKFIYRSPHGGIFFLGEKQIEDYNYTNELDRKDEIAQKEEKK